MARPREFDEQVVLEQAMTEFWAKGYEAVSMEDLTSATGLSRSSVYAAFGSKRGFFEASLDFYLEKQVSMMLADLESRSADLNTINAFFGMLESAAEENPDQFTLGCLMTNTMAELGHVDEPIRQVGTSYVERVHDAFANALRSQGMSDVEVTARADILTPLALGAFVIGRGTTKPIASTAAAVSQLVESWRA